MFILYQFNKFRTGRKEVEKCLSARFSAPFVAAAALHFLFLLISSRWLCSRTPWDQEVWPGDPSRHLGRRSHGRFSPKGVRIVRFR